MKRVMVFVLLAVTSAGVSAALLSSGAAEEGVLFDGVFDLVLDNSLAVLLVAGFAGLLAARKRSSLRS